ncbi:MAG: prepilin-type N-terminal cleavage/methylation domain-containing protein [Syntrophobacteraceae bacterium]|jgi:type IV pilus assembly protein PilE|nr:prepilin-type N-terminal cleavage/methylation domain-containing protein [Syntrophobacteraceae bacterium]
MSSKPGFTLVELMVVVSICAILASVAIPAYVNHVHRARQTEAVDALMQAKMDQELFWADTFPCRYASTIGCLASFGGNCANTTYTTASSYRVTVSAAGTQHFQVSARKSINGQTDLLHVSDTVARPVVNTPNALNWSIFHWIFN